MTTKRRKSPWTILIIGAALVALAILLGFASSNHYGRPPKPFVAAFILMEFAVLLLLSTIQDLLNGKVKMERYGARSTYKRSNITYWFYVVTCLALAALCVWKASTVFLR
jgi:hypothetical protein